MEENPNVNRALSALLKELEHIKDLTSMADGYREVADELSTSVQDYHKLNSAYLCQIEEVCNRLNPHEIMDFLEASKDTTKTYSQQIIEEVKTVAHHQSKVIDRVDNCESAMSKNLDVATQSISTEINALKDHVVQIIRDSSDNNRQVILEHISKIEAKIIELDVKNSELSNELASVISEHGRSILAFLKENNDKINNELKSIQSKISDLEAETHSLKKFGIATIIGIAIVIGTVILSLCL